MSTSDKITVVKKPIVRAVEGDSSEYSFQDRIIYYVRLSNGMVITNPSDFPNDLEKDDERLLVKREQANSEACE